MQFDAAGLFDSVEHGQQVLTDPAIRKRLASFGTCKGMEPILSKNPQLKEDYQALLAAAKKYRK